MTDHAARSEREADAAWHEPEADAARHEREADATMPKRKAFRTPFESSARGQFPNHGYVKGQPLRIQVSSKEEEDAKTTEQIYFLMS
jgi:hypothetical protein